MVLKQIFILLSVVIVSTYSYGQTKLSPVWDNGLKFNSEDGSTTLNVGGRLHYDVAFTSHSKELDSIAGTPKDNLEVRRARLSFGGTIHSAIKYEFEFTFGEQIRFADLYLAFLKFPFFEQVTAGHFREPFGMEENTSSNSTVFMERSLTSAFAPGRNAGIMVQKPFLNKKLRVYAGAFRITNSLGADTESEGKHSITGRAAYVPILDSVSNKALHIGFATNHYSPLKRTYQLNVENETHTGGAYIKSGEINDVTSLTNIGTELGYTYRRFSFQSEYMHSFVNLSRIQDSITIDRTRDFNSYYATASYFVGNGKRTYSEAGNRFSSISVDQKNPNRPYKGAWEVAVRFSRIFLKESIMEIKKMSDITFGINWYYSPNIRIMLNYIVSQIQDKYKANAFQLRLQAVF